MGFSSYHFSPPATIWVESSNVTRENVSHVSLHNRQLPGTARLVGGFQSWGQDDVSCDSCEKATLELNGRGLSDFSGGNYIRISYRNDGSTWWDGWFWIIFNSRTPRRTIFCDFFDYFFSKKRVLQPPSFLILFGIRIMERWISEKDQNPLFGRWARNMVDLFFSLKVFS